MGWIDAFAVVARMQDHEAFWDWADMSFIRIAMGAQFFVAQIKASIAVYKQLTLPFPALCLFVL